MRDIRADAASLRALHRPAQPLILANSWDPPSARLSLEAGFPVVATSSAAIAETAGFDDHGHLPPDLPLDRVALIAGAVDAPITADMEDGYGLAPRELVVRLAEAGASGFNIEDSDHAGGGLKPMQAQAELIRALRDATTTEGVDLVINARIDTVLHAATPEEGLARAAAYRSAGADCVFPIGVANVRVLSQYCELAPTNGFLRRDGPSVGQMRAAGVSRISLGAGLYRLSMRAAKDRLAAIAKGEDEELWGK